MRKLTYTLSALALSVLGTACSQKENTSVCAENNSTCCTESAPQAKQAYTKKYTNADYYKDGVFQADIALKAYLDMFEHYGVEYTNFLKENMFVSDFNLGDFENVGMAGVFWVNNPTAGYVGHNIYLLPSQAIVEHTHMATEFPAKMESWYVEHGSAYNFGFGEPTPNPPAMAKSQEQFRTVKNFVKLETGDTASLGKVETPHFLMAGENGAVVIEAGNYHDGSGLRFTNPSVKFIDALADLKEKKLELQK